MKIFRIRGKIIRTVLCCVLCTAVGPNAFLYVFVCLINAVVFLSCLLFLCYIYIYICILHECVVIVTWWGGPGGIEAYPWDHYFLQCFDTVGWVI